MPKAAKNVEAVGIVRPGELLTIAAAKRDLGIGDWGWREFSKGLPTILAGRNRYVFTDDILTRFQELRDEQNGEQR